MIVALIVCHSPDPERLDELLASLRQQVDRVLLIDNASPSPPLALTERYAPWAVLLPQSRNLGLGAAYNLGAHAAIELGASHIQTFDQDSVCTPGMVWRLTEAEAMLRQRGVPVGALGPLYLDDKLATPPRLPRLAMKSQVNAIPVAYTINSGLLIPLAAFKRIGRFDESLFIQYVDVEWGWRALSLGLPCHVIEDAVLRHDLGERIVRVPGSQRRIPVHAPARNYYFFRNALELARRPYIPLKWRIKELIKLAIKIPLQCLLFDQPWQRLRHALAGVRDAWRGIGGAREDGRRRD